MIATGLLTAPDAVLIQDEPALDLALPRVFHQPPKPAFTRDQAPVDPLVRRALEVRDLEATAAWGEAYGELAAAFQPALRWATSCWEYLLSTEGCRFVPRTMGEKRYCRGDYRALTEIDFPRLVHRVFKQCLLDYLPATHGPSFAVYLRQTLWPSVLAGYRRLEQPADHRQRTLTPWSYLRCTPYQFLNEYHDGLVHATISTLPRLERRAIESYYLRFYTDEAAGRALRLDPATFHAHKARALRRLRSRARLPYHLLLQIERY